MNVSPLIAAADALKHAIEVTFEPKERADIESARRHVTGILARRGVFLGTIRPPPQPDNEDAQAILAALQRLKNAASVLLTSADNTGCTPDMTVVGSAELIELAKTAGVTVTMEHPLGDPPLTDAETLRALADPNRRDPIGDLAVELVDAVRYEVEHGDHVGDAAWNSNELTAAAEKILQRYHAEHNFKP